MLTMTPAASTVVKTLIAQNPEVEDGGLRIDAGGAEGVDFAVSITEVPEPTDSVVESDGAKVFLGESAVMVLDDKVLDASVDDAGAVQFAIAQQG
ncbi:Fe-S cluster assembly protein HesB [Schumannella soli]|uniref:Fe-S cluster assembly protein HesB n=2 Tax=Schumannella soli TaxID=2590779 RepID=A0A506Y578_9MICO|nr:Fe-S cluster assembly protein HesB [Schumannella soli]